MSNKSQPDPTFTDRKGLHSDNTDEIRAVRRLLREQYEIYNSWPKVARDFGLSPAMAWRIVEEEGYQPKRKDIRQRLGLSPTVEVMCDVEIPSSLWLPPTTKFLTCPTCGRVFARTSNAMKYCSKECRK